MKRAEVLRIQEESDMGAVIATPAGRRFVWGLLVDRCRIKGKVPAGTDGLMLQGRRDFAIDLDGDLRTLHPKLWLAMWTEGLASEVEEQLHKDKDKQEPDDE